MDTVKVVFISKSGVKKAEATLEVANTPTTRARGLSKRAVLTPGRGMIFDTAGAFWMKDVEFPLDLTFISKNGEVLETLAMPVDKEGIFHYSPSTHVSKDAEYSIETPMGWIEDNGIAPGDVVKVKEVRE